MDCTAQLIASDPPLRRIGGSDIAKLLGISKYGNAANVYQRIVEGIDEPWNKFMERGAAVEPELRAYGQRLLGVELETTESDYHLHPSFEFANAQIDDLGSWRGKPVAIDYKSTSRWAKGWGAQGTDQIPEHIHAQVAWELLCSDRDLGLVIVGFGEDEPAPKIFTVSHIVWYEMERCPEFESYAVAVAREFWEQHVIPRIPPDCKPLTKKGSK